MADHATSESDQALPQTRRSWLKTAALSLALLLSGAVIGSGVTVIALRRRADEARRHPEWLSRRTLARMRDRLDLSDAQAEQIRQIFANTRRQAQMLRGEHRREARAIMDVMHEDVSAVLTPEQRAEWERWIRRARERAFRRNGPKEHRKPPRRGGTPPSPPDGAAPEPPR